MSTNSNLNSLTARVLKEKLKHGCGTLYFKEKYNVDEEGLITYIDKTFSAKASAAFKRDLSRNDKHPKKDSPKEDESIFLKTEETPSNTPALEQNVPDEPDICSECIETFPSTPSLESLKEKEEKLTRLMIEEEAKHSDLITQRAALKEKFNGQKKLLLDYTRKVNELKSEFDKTLSSWNELGAEMKNRSDAISSIKRELEGVREEISILSTISILVYSNGDTELDNSDIALPSSPEKELDLLNKIIQIECAEGLTLKNIRQLAKLKLFTEELENSSIKFEITFETETLEEVFKSIN